MEATESANKNQDQIRKSVEMICSGKDSRFGRRPKKETENARNAADNVKIVFS